MLALLAAVPEETRLLRASLEKMEAIEVAGLRLWNGEFRTTRLCLAHCGIGKAAAAAGAVTLLNHCQPEALWLFGCGGSYLNSRLGLGDLALADQETFVDEGAETGAGFRSLHDLGLPMRKQGNELFFNNWPLDNALLRWAEPLLNEHVGKAGRKLAKGHFVTVSTCTGTTVRSRQLEQETGGICENMEGAAVALACRQLGVPLLELRGISNLVEDRDPSRWDLSLGMQAAQEAILSLLASWPAGEP